MLFLHYRNVLDVIRFSGYQHRFTGLIVASQSLHPHKIWQPWFYTTKYVLFFSSCNSQLFVLMQFLLFHSAFKNCNL